VEIQGVQAKISQNMVTQTAIASQNSQKTRSFQIGFLKMRGAFSSPLDI